MFLPVRLFVPGRPHRLPTRGVAGAIVFLLVLAGLPRGVAEGPADPPPENSERAGEPMGPEATLAAIETRLAASVTLLAAEPTIRNPVAAAVDASGRILVAENLTYAEKPLKTDLRFRDRVTMLEDADCDGRAERQAILVDGLEGLASVAVGRGGLWLLCPPRLLFIPGGHLPPPGWPEAPDSDEPARRREAAIVVLDGFTVSPTSHHTFANGLAWGPDGWLYGRCGASSPGEISVPGSAADQRVPLRGGIWRYHPERQVFEAICHGTTNPWGLDWDDLGNGFFTNTVNGHLWRVLPGAHYARSHTVEPHPWVLDPLGQHADHDHFDSSRHWTESRDGRADAHGGGHAHTGCLIVPDEPGWPEALRGRLLTLNLHGRRINVDRLDAGPAGIVGRHEPDLARFGDPFFRGTDLVAMPAERIAILDWSDTGECHEGTGVHRTSGRIYSFDFCARGKAAPPVDLSKLPARELVELLSADRWQARMALHLLADRHAGSTHAADLDAIVPVLDHLLAQGATPTLRLRGLWALWAIRRIDEPGLSALLDDPEPNIRAWAVRLLADAWPIDTVFGGRPSREPQLGGFTLDALERLAIVETDPEVRLAVACVLARLPPGKRARVAAALVAMTVADDDEAATGPDFGPVEGSPRALGGDHHDLGAMLYTGLLPTIVIDPEGVIDVWKAACVSGADEAHWPGLRRAIARRMTAADAGPGLAHLLAAVATGGPAGLADCLTGLDAGWRGRHHVDRPTGWDDVRAAIEELPDDDPRRGPLLDTAARLDALFDDPRGVATLVATARDSAGPVSRRAAALDSLVDVRAGVSATLCRELLSAPGLSPAAIRGLLAAGLEEDARRIVAAYPRLDPAGRDAALAALAARVPWAGILVDALEGGDVPSGAVTPVLARQLAGLGDAHLRSRLAALDPLPTSAGDPATRIDQWKSRLSPPLLATGDPVAGRRVWLKQCAACHRMHGEGGTLGPDLTGSGRHDLDYLLANIVTPSATVSPDYRMRQVVLSDGRVLSGIVVRRTAETLLLGTPTGEETVPSADVEAVIDGGVSLMPEGLLDRLDDAEAIDLIRFLMEP